MGAVTVGEAIVMFEVDDVVLSDDVGLVGPESDVDSISGVDVVVSFDGGGLGGLGGLVGLVGSESDVDSVSGVDVLVSFDGGGLGEFPESLHSSMILIVASSAVLHLRKSLKSYKLYVVLMIRTDDRRS